jgi:hypothetical protein
LFPKASTAGYLEGKRTGIKEKWCDAGLQKITDDVAARHAPYREHLKADKLSLVIDETHGGVTSYALPGGKYTARRI